MRIQSRQKGKRGENELVKILNENFGEGRFKRTPFSGALVGGKNREATKDLDYKEAFASDIIAPSSFNFILEHKFYAESNFWELFSDKSNWNNWIKQVEEDAKFVNKRPMLVIKYNRHKRIALVDYNYLIGYLSNKDLKFTKDFIWKGYSVNWFEDYLELPKDFWFSEEL